MKIDEELLEGDQKIIEKHFDLVDDEAEEPIYVNYDKIEKKKVVTIREKKKLDEVIAPVEQPPLPPKKKKERRIISFSEFDTFEQNRTRLWEIFSKDVWQITNEDMRTTDHFIEIEREIVEEEI